MSIQFEIDRHQCMCDRCVAERRVLIAALIWRSVPSKVVMVEAATRELFDAIDNLKTVKAKKTSEK